MGSNVLMVCQKLLDLGVGVMNWPGVFHARNETLERDVQVFFALLARASRSPSAALQGVPVITEALSGKSVPGAEVSLPLLFFLPLLLLPLLVLALRILRFMARPAAKVKEPL